jgi:hypothetical protein
VVTRLRRPPLGVSRNVHFNINQICLLYAYSDKHALT